VSDIVSKQSLDTLANLALTELRIRDNRNSDCPRNAKAHLNLAGGSREALYKYLGAAESSEAVRDQLSAFTDGAEFGLAIAAAILTHQYDVNAICETIKRELHAVYTYQTLCVG
jgi:hypothetical protein